MASGRLISGLRGQVWAGCCSAPLLTVARTAERYGVGTHCGGLNETRLGVAAAMHTFSTVGAAGGLVPGSDFYFPFVVLDDEALVGGPQRDGGVLTLPDRPALAPPCPTVGSAWSDEV